LGLEHLHKEGIIYRGNCFERKINFYMQMEVFFFKDLKPENILLDAQGKFYRLFFFKIIS
jgi:serine/threonine protein kinase